jgi:hypothetical protein
VALAASEPFAVPLVAILERLRLQSFSLGVSITEQFARTLASSSSLAHLTTLRMTGAHHDRNVPAVLLRAAQLDRLHTLELPNCRLLDREAVTLAAEPRYTQIRRLDLTSTGTGPSDDVNSSNRLTASGVTALIAGNPELTALELRGNVSRRVSYPDALADTVFLALARVRPPLVQLGLGSMLVTTATLPALSALPTLEDLDLRDTLIDDTALDTLLALPNLTTLNLAHTNLTAAGADRILREARPGLRDLTLTVPRLSESLVARLHARFTLHRWH